MLVQAARLLSNPGETSLFLLGFMVIEKEPRNPRSKNTCHPTADKVFAP